MVDQSLHDDLRKFLNKYVAKRDADAELAVIDAKIGGLIKSKLNIQCVSDSRVQALFRGIREHMTSLIEGLQPKQLHSMMLGLGHSLSRYKLKFSPDKVDTMVVQAISLLDDLDKEINTYAMRVKEWFSWHFPELVKIVKDNYEYVRCVQKMKIRTNAANEDFGDVLEDESVEKAMKEAAVMSMGTDIAEEDIESIQVLCEQVRLFDRNDDISAHGKLLGWSKPFLPSSVAACCLAQ